MKQKEREKRRMCVEGLATLRELGYSKKDAAWALLQTDGDMDGAYRVRDCRRHCKNKTLFFNTP